MEQRQRNSDSSSEDEVLPDNLQPSMYAEMTLAEMAGIKEWLTLQQQQLASQLESAEKASQNFKPTSD